MKNLLYILVLFLSFSCSLSEKSRAEYTPNPKTIDSSLLEVDPGYKLTASKIDKFFKQKLKRRLFNGTILFAQDGKIVHKGAYGFANYKKKTPLEINSVFQLASVSKPLTAYAILYLYEQGELSLNDTIDKFIPEFPYKGITIKHLLTHRSGLTNYMYFTDEKWADWTLPISNREVIDLMIEHKPSSYYKPNRRYNYSNTGYIILADIVERVSGMTFERFMRKKIFEPLGMKNSKVKPYRLGQNYYEPVVGHIEYRFRRIGKTYLNGTVGDKGIYSTVEDMFIWDRALKEGSLVSKRILNEAFEGCHKDLRKNDNYGYGWRINDVNENKKIVYHRGWWKGFRTYFIRVLDEDKTIVVLNNSTYGRFLKNSELIDLLS